MLTRLSALAWCVLVDGGSERAGVKCMMDGCRTMIPADADVCETCRRKQLQAYEGSLRDRTLHYPLRLLLARLPSLVLIAQAVFLLERGKTDRQTNRRD